MKNVMRAFYSDDAKIKEIWQDNKTLFVFDTNILLNLYEYAKTTREDFFNILEALKSRIWIPYHVALEYQKRRLDIVKNEKAIFRKVKSSLSKIAIIKDKDIKDLDLKRRNPNLNLKIDKLFDELSKSIDKFNLELDNLDKEQPCVRSHDSIREKLDILFKDKVGLRPTEEWLDEIYIEGKDRYANKIPPGFEDEHKENSPEATFYFSGLKYIRQYSDLIIWKQIIEKAHDENIANVIYVTGDFKKDWWLIIDSAGEKHIGCRAELKEEICNKSNVNFFQTQQLHEFLEYGKELLKIKINDKSIEEAKHSTLSNHRYIILDNHTINKKHVEIINTSNLNNIESYESTNCDLDYISKLCKEERDIDSIFNLKYLSRQIEKNIELTKYARLLFKKGLITKKEYAEFLFKAQNTQDPEE